MDLPISVTATSASFLIPEDNVHLYQGHQRLETPGCLCLGLSEVLTSIFLKASPLHETGLGEFVSKCLTSGTSYFVASFRSHS